MAVPAWAQFVRAPYFETESHIGRVWTREDGLPQNSGYALLQSSDGYLWIGTDNGLARFDGLEVRHFHPATTDEAIGHTMVTALCEGPDGAIWIGTDAGGLTRYRDGTFRRFTVEDGLGDNRVYFLLTDRRGRIWAGTGNGLSRISEDRIETFRTEDGLPENHVTSLLEDQRGRIWSTTGGGIAVYANGAFRRVELPAEAGSWAWRIAEDRSGDIWIGTERGVVRYANGTMKRFSTADGLDHDTVGMLFVDSSNRLWVGTHADGLNWFDGSRFLSMPSGPEGHQGAVLSMIEDREGNLWIGTRGYGLVRLRPRLVNYVDGRHGFSQTLIRPVLADAGGGVWAGSSAGVLYQVRPDGSVRTFTSRDGLNDRSVFALATAPAEGVYVGYGGAPVQHLVDGEAVNLPGAPSWLQTRALFTASDGSLWVGTEQGGAFRFHDGTWRRFLAPEDLPDNTVRTLIEFPYGSGTMWIGTEEGLVRLEGEERTVFTTADGLDWNAPRVLLEDPESREPTLWIGTLNGGLSRYRNGEIRSVGRSDGLCGDPPSLVDDRLGRLWSTCSDGIYYVEKSELNAFLDGKVDRVSSVVLGSGVGFRGEANGGFQPSSARSADGRLWFPNTAGVAYVRPAEVLPLPVAPIIHIERVETDDDDFTPVANELTLNPGHRRLSFHFVGVSLSAPEKVRYRHRLVGLDDEWTDSSRERVATYVNLGPGTYTFEVTAIDHGGVWSEEPALLTVTLRPHFLQTRLFYVLCAVAFVLIGLGIYHLRIRELRQREEALRSLVDARTHALHEEMERAESARQVAEDARHEVEKARSIIERQAEDLRALDVAKSRFFANLSHDFRTPLTLILAPLDRILDSDDAIPQAAHKSLLTARRQAQTLLTLINQLLDLSRMDSGRLSLSTERVDAVSFLKEIIDSFSASAEESEVQLMISASPSTIFVEWDPDRMEQVFRNLIANALKFTPAGGRVDVGLEARNQAVRVMVRDTGHGIPEDEQPHVFDRFYQGRSSDVKQIQGSGIGLALAKEFIELHAGTISVESRLGEGTTFVISLPVIASVTSGAGVSGDGTAKTSRPPEMTLSSEMEDRGPNVPARGDPTADGAQRPAILVVEDNAEMLEFLAESLSDEFDVRTASDGLEALEAVRRQIPDLILSDVMMPGMDGFELCSRIRESPSLAHVPVILLTAKASRESEISGLEVGADEYVTKPFDIGVLRARITALAARSRALRETLGRRIVLQPGDVEITSADEAFLESVRSSVEEHLGDPGLSVDSLAEGLNVSTRHLQRRLGSLAGQSPASFIRSFRLQRAAQMLENRAGSVSEIAYRVGFKNAAHFTRAFREHFGYPPSRLTRDSVS